MTHQFTVKDNGGIKVGLRDRGTIIELRGSVTLTRDWDLDTYGITPYDTFCTIYCYATFQLGGNKLKYFNIEVEDKYATKPHKVVAINTRNKWSIEISLISLVGGPGSPDPPDPQEDVKVKATAEDPTTGYLAEKLSAGPEIALSVDVSDPDSYKVHIRNAGPFTFNLTEARIEQRSGGHPIYIHTGESLLFETSGEAFNNFENTIFTVDWTNDFTVVSAKAISNKIDSEISAVEVYKVKYGSADNTPNYLGHKVTHGPEISLASDATDPNDLKLRMLNTGPFTRFGIDESPLGYIRARTLGEDLYIDEGIHLASILYDAANSAGVSGQLLSSTASGTAWVDHAAADTTYSISAITDVNGALLRLTGSDATTDDVLFKAGTGTTIGIVDDSTIEIGLSGGGGFNYIDFAPNAGTETVQAVDSSTVNILGGNVITTTGVTSTNTITINHDAYTAISTHTTYTGGVVLQNTDIIVDAYGHVDTLTFDSVDLDLRYLQIVDFPDPLWTLTAGNLYPTTITNNVGIGIALPVNKLHVLSSEVTVATIDYGSNRGTVKFAESSTSGYPFIHINNTTSGASLGAGIRYLKNSVKQFGFGVDYAANGTRDWWVYDYVIGAPRLLINPIGNVGLGTPSPTERLHVVGSIRVEDAYYDSNNETGTAGQILSSTAVGTDWIDQFSMPVPSALTRINDTNVTLTLGGTPDTSLLEAVSLTLGWTGTLADDRIASAVNWNTAYAHSQITSGNPHNVLYSELPDPPSLDFDKYVSWSLGVDAHALVPIIKDFKVKFHSGSNVTLTQWFPPTANGNTEVNIVINSTQSGDAECVIINNNVNNNVITASGHPCEINGENNFRYLNLDYQGLYLAQSDPGTPLVGATIADITNPTWDLIDAAWIVVKPYTGGSGVDINQTTGIYTVPETGQYTFIFTFQIAVADRPNISTVSTKIVAFSNGTDIILGATEIELTDFDTEFSYTRVTNLNQGDTVWVEQRGGTHAHESFESSVRFQQTENWTYGAVPVYEEPTLYMVANMNPAVHATSGMSLGKIGFQGKYQGRIKHTRPSAYITSAALENFGINYGATLEFWTVSTGTSVAQQVMIIKDNKVGIGIYPPIYKLDVSGDVRISSMPTGADGDLVVTSLSGALRTRTAEDILLDAGGLPITPAALTKIDDTNVTLSLAGNPSTALLQVIQLTLGWTGTLADNRITHSANWNAAYTHSQITSGNPHQVTWSELIGTQPAPIAHNHGTGNKWEMTYWEDTVGTLASSSNITTDGSNITLTEKIYGTGGTYLDVNWPTAGIIVFGAPGATTVSLALRNTSGTPIIYQFQAGHLEAIPGAAFSLWHYEDSTSGENREVRFYGYPSGESKIYGQLKVVPGPHFDISSSAGDVQISPGSGFTAIIGSLEISSVVKQTSTATYVLTTESNQVKYRTPADIISDGGGQLAITPAALTRTNDTNITLSLGGTPGTALLQATSLTLGWTGTLADSRITNSSNWNTAYTHSQLTSGNPHDVKFADLSDAPTMSAYMLYTDANQTVSGSNKVATMSDLETMGGEYFVATIDPTGNNYPDTTGETNGAYWIIEGLGTGVDYTFTTGHLSGETVADGYKLLSDGTDSTDGTGLTIIIPPAVAWGSIGGTLANQTDLSTALSGKAPLVHTHGTYDNSTALTGANVYSNISITDGIVTGLTSRSLTASDIGAQPAGTYDNYVGWNLYVGGISKGTIIKSEKIDFVGGTNVTIAHTTTNDNTLTISSVNTVYTHPTYDGDDIDEDSGALTDAIVISDIDINVTTDTLGHVTDANAYIATRTLTLADLGYTGDADANKYVHPNHSGHITSVADGSTLLRVAAITGQTALTSGLVSTDELLLSDAGVIKRMDVSVIETYMQNNLTFTINTDTNYYLTGVSGSGNGTVTFTVNGTTNPTWSSAHTHTHASITGKGADDHHPQVHDHSTHTNIGVNDHHNQVHTLVSLDHTASGLTTGHVLTALSATTFGFSAIPAYPTPNLQAVTDIGNVTTNSIAVGSSSAPTYTLDVTGSFRATTASVFNSTLTVGSTFTTSASNIMESGWTRATLAMAGRAGAGTSIQFPKGAFFESSGNPITGYLKITWPFSVATMYMIQLDVLNYSGVGESATTYFIGGYNNSSTGNVPKNSVITTSNPIANLPIRWGYDVAGTMCIWIGEANTDWRYPKVVIRNVTVGYSGGTLANWWDKFTITTTSTLGTVTGTKTNQLPITNYDTLINKPTLSPMVYPAAGIALSTGSAWSTSITNNSSNWNTAFGWGDHAGLYVDLSTVQTVAGAKTWSGAATFTANTGDGGTSYAIEAEGSINLASGENYYINDIPISVFIDAPHDGDLYARKDSAWASLGSGAGTVSDLSLGTAHASTVTIINSGGDNVTLPAATITVAGVMTAALKTKLDGIATNANLYVHPNHTGHVTSSADGATVFTVTGITGQTALTSGLISTDELVLSDGGVIKRMDISVLQTYMQNALTFTTNTDTNYYLTGVSGSGNGTVTFTVNGATNPTWSSAHTHAYDNYSSWQLHTAGSSLTNVANDTPVNFVGGTLIDLTADSTSGYNTLTFSHESITVSGSTDANAGVVITDLTFSGGHVTDYTSYDMDNRYPLSTTLNNYVLKAGDTMTGILNMNMYSTTNHNTVNFYRGRGTSAVPSSLLSGDIVGDIKFDGYIGGSAHLGYLRVQYFENLVGTIKGSAISLVTQNGSYASGWDIFDVFTGYEDGSVLLGQSPETNFRPINGYNTIDNNTPIWLANDTQVYGDLFVKDGVHTGAGYCLTMNNVSNTGFNYVATNLLDLELAGSKKFRFTLGTGQFEADGDVIAFSSSISDRRLKTNIHSLSYSLEEIIKLEPISFIRKNKDDKRTHLGLIAQDVKEILPEIVGDYEDHLTLNYTEIIPVLINAIKELNSRIKELEK